MYHCREQQQLTMPETETTLLLEHRPSEDYDGGGNIISVIIGNDEDRYEQRQQLYGEEALAVVERGVVVNPPYSQQQGSSQILDNICCSSPLSPWSGLVTPQPQQPFLDELLAGEEQQPAPGAHHSIDLVPCSSTRGNNNANCPAAGLTNIPTPTSAPNHIQQL
jgi:hypothetical protein